MIKIRTSGYQSKSLSADITLGIFDGLENSLWCYAFATVIFAGAMAQFLPLLIVILLAGWAILGVYIAITSEKRVHIVSLDEQSVVILASIAGLMVAHMGEQRVQTDGLATMMVVMSLSSLGVAFFFWVIGHYRLTRLLELMPYPVICGFMAGIGWLMLEAGVGIAVDETISIGLVSVLKQPDNLIKLLLFIGAAIVLLVSVFSIRRSWALPVASIGLVIAFYAIVAVKGQSVTELIQQGWLFAIPVDNGGVLGILEGLSFSQVDISFVLSVVPQILTIAFLALLTQSMSLSVLMAAGSQDLDTSSEMADLGAGNVLNALIASPPGSTDLVGTILFEKFGASSRWMPIISSIICVVLAVFGSIIIPWMPKLLIGAIVFLFAYQLFHEWMYEKVRGFQPIDFAIALIILGTVIFFGFMQGIGVGLMLALLLFVLRYSMISAIQGQYSLASHRSSVERGQTGNMVLDKHGGECLVYSLRGFLFFGTANAILDTIRDDAKVRSANYLAILLDLKRVTGMDISALNTFVQIKTLCEMSGVKLIYSGVGLDMRKSLLMLEAVSLENGEPLIFSDADYAVEYQEDLILKKYENGDGECSIEGHLQNIFHDREKVELLMSAMDRVEVEKSEKLFEQGDKDTGLFILDRGSMTALIKTEEDSWKRVKKFRPGSLIGEMSAYTPDRLRTALVVADEPSVLFHLTTEKLAQLDMENLKLTASIHELVARTLGNRITYMNHRLFLELK